MVFIIGFTLFIILSAMSLIIGIYLQDKNHLEVEVEYYRTKYLEILNKLNATNEQLKALKEGQS